jgi:hypothetical protein
VSAEISERSFEEAIECALLRYGPDACTRDASAVRETPPPDGDLFVRSGPGTVKLPPQSATEYIRTRFPTFTRN